jgi:flagellum-specific ATP synthase
MSSISRVMKDVTTPQHQSAAITIRQLMSAYSEHEDLLSIGAYRRGTNRLVDVAVEMRDPINALLRQSTDATATFQQTVEQLTALAAICQSKLAAPAPAIGPVQNAPPGAGMRVGQ